MRSQKWKAIIIKDSKLRRVRTSLRIILNEAIRSELRHLNKLQYLYIEKRVAKKIIPSQSKRDVYLTKRSNELLQALTESVLNCCEGSRCKSIKENKLSPDIATLGENMVWNPLLKRWNCIKCYNFHYRTIDQKKKLENLLKQGEEESIFNEWLSKQIKHD